VTRRVATSAPAQVKSRWYESILARCPLAWFGTKPGYHWFVVGTVCVGAFMAALDASKVNVAMPTLIDAFGIGMNRVEWVSIAYLLTLTSLLTVLGSLSDHLGRKLFYTFGFAMFIVASALCGAAPSLTCLIVCRVLQAIGAAMLQANSVAIITAAVPARSRGKAIGFQGSAQAVGLSVGPAIGGLLIARFGWRSIFYTNLPVGALGAILALLILPRDAVNRAGKRFDCVGALALGPALVALMLALKDGYRLGWLSPTILLEVAIALALLFAFMVWESRCENPMVNLNLLKIWAFFVGNTTGVLSYCLLYGTLFLMPFYLEWALHSPPATTGFILAPLALAMMVTTPISGILSDRIGTRSLTSIGMAIAASGAALLAMLPRASMLVALILVGAGVGIFTPPNNSSVMGSVPSNHLGVAGGMLNMSRSVGMSLGIAAAGTLFGFFSGQVHVVDQNLAYPTMVRAFDSAFAGMAAIAVLAALIGVVRSQVARRGAQAA